MSNHSDNPGKPADKNGVDDILASIRDMIARDDVSRPVLPSVAAAAQSPAPDGEEEAPLLLTNVVREGAAPPRPGRAPREPDTGGEAALSAATEALGAAAFARLRKTVAGDREDAVLEAVVRDMLRVMLRDWLDENLPRIVERMVQKEIDRLSESARRGQGRG